MPKRKLNNLKEGLVRGKQKRLKIKIEDMPPEKIDDSYDTLTSTVETKEKDSQTYQNIRPVRGRKLNVQANQSFPLQVQKCSVISCPNVDDAPARSISYFFTFPKDEALCGVWKEKCGLASNHSITNAKVCADHFLAIDFKSPKTLTANAIPKQNLHWMLGAPAVKDSDLKYNKQKKCWHLLVNKKNTNKKVLDINEVKKEVETKLMLEQRCELLVEEQKKLAKQQEVYQNKIDRMHQTITKIKTELENHNRKTAMNSDNILYNIFSQAQISVLLGEKEVIWTHDDMARAFVLRHIGNEKLYLYLKNELYIPLPYLYSVEQWATAAKILENNNFQR